MWPAMLFEVGPTGAGYHEWSEMQNLPYAAHTFRSFRSRTSGSCTAAESYVKEVTRLARQHFGQRRIHYWTKYGFSG